VSGAAAATAAWRLWERGKKIRVRVCVGKVMMTWQTLIGDWS